LREAETLAWREHKQIFGRLAKPIFGLCLDDLHKGLKRFAKEYVRPHRVAWDSAGTAASPPDNQNAGLFFNF